MTMRVTLTTTVMGESGSLLAAGSTYTVSEAFGASLVNSGRATDTDRALTPAQTELKPYLATDPLTGGSGLLVNGVIYGLGQISSKLLACIPAHDASTRFNDVSGLANHLLVEAGNSGAFGTDGYFSTTAATTGGLNIPKAQINWNPSTESMILSFVMKRAIPGANENVLSIGATTAGYQGFYLSHRVTTGKMKIVGVKNDASLVAQADSSLAFSDATPKDRIVTVAYDAPTGSFYLWRDGVLSDSFVGAMALGGANAFSNAISNAELRVGALAAISGNACVVVTGYGLQLAKYVGALPVNIGVIAARLAETPRIPVSGVEL